MSPLHHSRRDVLKLLGSVPLVAAAGTPVVTAGQVATPKKARLCLVSRHLQWAGIEEGIATAAEAGCQGIAWTVRSGAHILAENVERDLRKAVELTRKAGLDTPMVISAIVDAKSPRAEAILSTMQGLGIRYFRAPSFRYDYSQELEPQLEALKPRIGSMAELNQKYGTTAMYHTHSGAGNIGGGVWDLWLVLKQFDRELVVMLFAGGAKVFGVAGRLDASLEPSAHGLHGHRSTAAPGRRNRKRDDIHAQTLRGPIYVTDIQWLISDRPPVTAIDVLIAAAPRDSIEHIVEAGGSGHTDITILVRKSARPVGVRDTPGREYDGSEGFRVGAIDRIASAVHDLAALNDQGLR